MIELASNGNRSSKWQGSDDSTIVYPGIEICITVTCAAKGKLAGLHLIPMAGPHFTEQDIVAYGTIAKGATAMYVVGMLSDQWTEGGRKNQSGLAYVSQSGGTLIERLRDATGFQGVVNVFDTSGLGDTLTITASLSSAGVTFTYAVKSGAAQQITGFTQVGGNVMPMPKKRSGGCTIL